MRKFIIVFLFFLIPCGISLGGSVVASSPSLAASKSIQETEKTQRERHEKVNEGGDKLKERLDFFSSVGTFGSFVVALVAAVYAYFQYRNNKRENRRALAYQNYSSFLLLSFNNTDLAKPSTSILSIKHPRNLQYKYFVANMLFAFEQIFLAVDGEEDWLNAMTTQLERHKAHLIISKSLEEKHWNAKFSEFAKGVIS